MQCTLATARTISFSKIQSVSAIAIEGPELAATTHFVTPTSPSATCSLIIEISVLSQRRPSKCFSSFGQAPSAISILLRSISTHLSRERVPI
jgi:hypothetical protein